MISDQDTHNLAGVYFEKEITTQRTVKLAAALRQWNIRLGQA